MGGVRSGIDAVQHVYFVHRSSGNTAAAPPQSATSAQRPLRNAPSLHGLLIAYKTARIAADDAAIVRTAQLALERNTCIYCGERWSSVLGYPHFGHARCIVGIDFQRTVAQLLERGAAVADVARVCGVGTGTVISWRSNVLGPIERARRREIADRAEP